MRAAERGLNAIAAVVAIWEHERRRTGRSMDVRLHPKRWRQLNRALVRADQTAGDGRGRRGHGVAVTADLIDELVLRRWEPIPVTSRHPPRTPALRSRNAGTEVQSLAHVVCLLDQETRGWRRAIRERAAAAADHTARGGDAG